MTPLIQRPGLQALPTPYVVTKSRTAAFAVPVEAAALQQLLDTTLNAAAGSRRFEPLLDFLVLTFIHYPDVHAKQEGIPAAQRWGFFTYQECAVFLLLKDKEGDGLGSCWHVPMILLNEGIPLILGREVYGMPKVFARVDARPLQVDDWLTNPAGIFKVSTDGFAQPGAGNGVRFVDVAQVALKGLHLSLPDFHLPNFDPLNLLDFAARIVSPDERHHVLFEFFRHLVSIGLPGIFLRQLPGGEGDCHAVFQQLLKAAFIPTAVTGLTYVLADVTPFDPASYPLASTFGLAPGQAHGTIGIVAEISWELPAPTDL